jgi:hypothetical protein
VWYRRYYGYNLDGSRAMVMRDDALNGTHWDVYAYDPVSGRLVSVTDTVPEPDVVHSFAWNPEGTLARWSSNELNSYARVFGYDEEGRLVKIERDYGSGGVQVAYEYGYNSDGARVWKRDVLNGQEYRYVCRIGCGGVPMRVYNRPMNGGSWASVEDYLVGPGVNIYILISMVLFWISLSVATTCFTNSEGGNDIKRLFGTRMARQWNCTYLTFLHLITYLMRALMSMRLKR